ncbi:MAG: SOS response-associated peptidase [Caldilineaceae bacterium]|nr:SOS response-associated peptidase [Caldilineaceae bacterium]
MCGRFVLRASPQNLQMLFDLDEAPQTGPRYNIAPTQPVLAVRTNPHGGLREATYLNWGLIPFWAKDPKIGSRMINARSETAAEKPSFRAAYKYRRCIVPADGFFEWQKERGGKQPYLIGLESGEVFGIAGLWEHWERDGSAVESCTLLTTAANEFMEPLHHRMPVILDRRDYDEWLDPGVQTAGPLLHLMRPFDGAPMRAVAVSKMVNNARNDESGCVEPAGA